MTVKITPVTGVSKVTYKCDSCESGEVQCYSWFLGYPPQTQFPSRCYSCGAEKLLDRQYPYTIDDTGREIWLSQNLDLWLPVCLFRPTPAAVLAGR
jgi:hypothetical protein